MTTVAWDGETLAADRLTVGGNLKRTITKLYVCGDFVYGGAGMVIEIMQVVDWLRRGAKTINSPSASSKDDCGVCGIAIHKSRKAFIVEWNESHTRLMPCEEPAWAIGCGRDFAIAAMACGKTAAEAVEIAARFDAGTGHGVNVVRFGRKWPPTIETV